VEEAFYDAAHASEMCLAGTREQLLLDLAAWFDDRDPARERVFWLNGLAGTGKTTVARTIAARAHQEGRLAAAFFFSRNIAATRAPSAILPTIAYQLAHYQQAFRSSVCTAIASDRHVSTRVIAAQARILFKKIELVSVSNEPLLIVLDALDECNIEGSCQGGDAIPLLLSNFRSLPHIKILITSRAEGTIKRMFNSVANQFALQDIERNIVQGDIHRYLKHRLTSLAHTRELPLPFPTNDVLDELVRRAGTLFIYAATVVKWVSNPYADPKLYLKRVLEQDANEVAFQHKMLDQMYTQILVQAAETTGNPKPHERALGKILSAVVLLQEPMPPAALAVLVDEEEQANVILSLLSAVLLVDDEAPVRLFHPSFLDFITNKERCKNPRFCVTRLEGHKRLATRCLEIINAGICRDICNIRDSSLLNSKVPDLEENLARRVPGSFELWYACRYWHDHLQASGMVSHTGGLLAALETFCVQSIFHLEQVRLPPSEPLPSRQPVAASPRALVIGINKYKNTGKQLQDLNGCVADADDMYEYLIVTRRMSPESIIRLNNEDATRAKILDGIRALRDSSSPLGDPIIIFWAGHGSRGRVPPGWDTSSPDGKIEMLIPYDFDLEGKDEGTPGLLDYQFGRELAELAQEKGDNIVSGVHLL
jgi:hypothetical protein